MGADRTYIRCFDTHYQMAAVAALPQGNTTLFKYGLCFHIVQQLAIALLMGLLDSGNCAELCCKLGKALFLPQRP